MKAPRRRWSICCLLAAAIVAGCTATIGTPNPELLRSMSAAGEFGGEQTVRVCGLLDSGITEAMAHRIIDEAWNETEAAPLGLKVELVSLEPWKRESGDVERIFRNVRSVPIARGCDRLLAFLGPSDDVVSALAGGVSFTHGFVFATPEGAQRFTLMPAEVVRHEIYHLVGCGHASVMDECYGRIARAKANRNGADGFFPVFQYILDDDIRKNCGENPLITDRAEANRVAGRWATELGRQTTGAMSPARRCGA